MAENQRAQVRMTDDEIADFVTASRTATLATIGPDGLPHLVAMWYAVLDGEIWFETKAKSQKAVNLRRDDRLSCMIEDGLTYDVLRGVSIQGRGVVSEDPDDLLKVGISMWERYFGPYTVDQRKLVDAMMHNRVVVRLVGERTRSWDHQRGHEPYVRTYGSCPRCRKLNLHPMPVTGSTAEHLH
jgi:PPOX class probable F420-dependent enzyme